MVEVPKSYVSANTKGELIQDPELIKKVLGLDETGNFRSDLSSNGLEVFNANNSSSSSGDIQSRRYRLYDFKQGNLSLERKKAATRFNLIDLNGDKTIDDDEAIQELLQVRQRQSLARLEFLSVLNKNTAQIASELSDIDSFRDGQISDSEIIDAFINPTFQTTFTYFNKIISTNINASKIDNRFISFNTEGDSTTISDGEVATQINNYDVNKSKEEKDLDLLIFRKNTNFNTKFLSIDTNRNNDISKNEIFAELFRLKDQGLSQTQYDAEIKDILPILDSNENYEAILEEFDNLPINFYGEDKLKTVQLLLTENIESKMIQKAQQLLNNPEAEGEPWTMTAQDLVEDLAIVLGEFSAPPVVPTSLDEIRMDGLSGKLHDFIVNTLNKDLKGMTDEALSINDMNAIKNFMTGQANDPDVTEINEVYKEQHTNAISAIVNLNSLIEDGIDTDDFIVNIKSALTQNYQDLGLGISTGFSGFEDIVENFAKGIQVPDIVETFFPGTSSQEKTDLANNLTNKKIITELVNVYNQLLGQNIPSPSFNTGLDKLTELDNLGLLNILPPSIEDQENADAMKALIFGRYGEGIRGDDLFLNIGLDNSSAVDAAEKAKTLNKLEALFTSYVDVDSNGTVNAKDIKDISKYLSGVKEQEDFDASGPFTRYSTRKHLEVLAKLEEVTDKVLLGSSGNSYLDINHAGEVLSEVAEIYGDIFAFANAPITDVGSYSAGGSTAKMIQALQTAGLEDVGSYTKEAVSIEDLELLKTIVKEEMGFEADLNLNNSSHEQAEEIVRDAIGTAPSARDLLGAIANVYGDTETIAQAAGVDIYDYDGFTGAISRDLGIDFLDLSQSLTLSDDDLNKILASYDAILNPPEPDPSEG